MGSAVGAAAICARPKPKRGVRSGVRTCSASMGPMYMRHPRCSAVPQCRMLKPTANGWMGAAASARHTAPPPT
eukprot:4167848-Pyramimonas_sp.AAC.1